MKIPLYRLKSDFSSHWNFAKIPQSKNTACKPENLLN